MPFAYHLWHSVIVVICKHLKLAVLRLKKIYITQYLLDFYVAHCFPNKAGCLFEQHASLKSVKPCDQSNVITVEV